MIHTSRSKIVAPFLCPRYLYLKYHYKGKGLSRIRVAGPTLAGLHIHAGNARILTGTPPDDAVARTLAEFEMEFAQKSGGIPFADFILAEQKRLIEGEIRAFARVRAPKLLEGYEILTVEEEMALNLSPDVRYHSRMDCVQRNKQTGLLRVVDFKPCSYPSVSWVKKWERDPQVLAYVEVAESLFQLRAEGMQIEGYVKGQRRKVKDLLDGEVKVQNSPLCYIHKHKNGLSAEWKAGSVKVPITDVMSMKDYIEKWLTEEDIERLFFVTVPPIAPNPERLASWKRQTVASEKRWDIYAKIAEVDLKAVEDGLAQPLHFITSLDELFPQNFDACYKFGEDYPCEMEHICYNAQVAESPLESGLYEEREDHHSEEDVE